ncbi:hypothetical protein KGF51_09690 [Clostridioides sp. ZZV14-6045]|uniref:hypothetical protein n=1 Tax=Clostridioides sp. ZZV14-6045 TaxID=2811489 RepID=UPI001D11A31E|nr:hypothetical protein [Clostridioides sp. ZZV14-6045]
MNPSSDYLGTKHAIIACFKENEIIVSLFFYGEFHFIVQMPYKMDICKLPEESNIQGLVIDWENRYEKEIYSKTNYFL